MLFNHLYQDECPDAEVDTGSNAFALCRLYAVSLGSACAVLAISLLYATFDLQGCARLASQKQVAELIAEARAAAVVKLPDEGREFGRGKRTR